MFSSFERRGRERWIFRKNQELSSKKNCSMQKSGLARGYLAVVAWNENYEIGKKSNNDYKNKNFL